ncbi:hypothetical protein NFI96_026338 [Prochilodus magdalenae]|nr:hypothetical protein NFI96_026338 [Prochilodus magdalenae]
MCPASRKSACPAEGNLVIPHSVIVAKAKLPIPGGSDKETALDGEFLVRTHHVEYVDGGILDPDDMLTDLVEDRDKEILLLRSFTQLPVGEVDVWRAR